MPDDATPPAAPPPPLTPPERIARDRERDRLLTLANVQRMRGQMSEAQNTLEQALALGGQQPSPSDAPIHELRGDLLAADEKWDEAKAVYETARALDPSRASAERKFAQMTLRQSDARAERELAEAVLRGEAPLGGAGRGSGSVPPKRNAGLALLLSAFVPGFGQIFNGQLAKGLICLGVFLFTLLALRLSPDVDTFFAKIVQFFVPLKRVRGASAPVSPVLWLLFLLSAGVWLFSLIDAPLTASKREKQPDGSPKIDKSGWEV